MSALPTGTLTFLFTDIEGSTQLAQDFPDALPAALTRHHAILTETIEANDGHVFNIAGDAFCAAFPTATLALQAALSAQRALRAEAWGEAAVKVRMGLHSGEAEAQAGAYRGYVTLSYVQRLMSAASGGQVLVSSQSEALLRDQLPAGTLLRDLGLVQLRDFPRAEHVFQLVSPDLPSDFPPLTSLVAIPNNLPVHLTSFIGREQEIADVKQMLFAPLRSTGLHPEPVEGGRETVDRQQAGVRLLTLTGPGGTGKTRLLLAVASDVREAFPDGVWFVDLAPLRDPTLVPQTVASVLGVREQPGRPIAETLGRYLDGKHVLLGLDNCEHLLDACARLADALLRVAPHLTILAGSREALAMAGETVYLVPSLAVPALNAEFRVLSSGPASHASSRAATGQPGSSRSGPGAHSALGVSELLQYAAVRLFAERAVQANATFRLTDANAPAVAQICYRLDGIPLAIELAAARVKALSAEQIAARLDDRFHLLTGGSRTALPRHQTLSALIDWSYNLLAEPERVLLRRLSVFAGGWTLEAAEAVCSSTSFATSGAVAPDVRSAREPRGAAKDMPSAAAGREIDPAARDWPRAAEEVLDLLTRLVEKSLVMVDGEQGETRYRLLETIRQYARDRLPLDESELLRARHAQFYRRFAEEAEPQVRGAEQAVWWNRLDRERDNLRAAIEWSLRGGDVLTGTAIVCALWLFWYVYGYFSEAQVLLADILARPELAPHSRLRALALNTAGSFQARMPNALVTTTPMFEEALQIGRELNDRWNIGVATMYLSQLAFAASDFGSAERLAEQGLALWRDAGDSWFIGMALLTLGDVAQAQGEQARAQTLYQESVDALRRVREKNLLANPVRRLGYIALQQNAYAEAAAFFDESLRLNRDVGERLGIGCCLAACAALALARGEPVRAANLFGAMQALIDSIGAEAPPRDQIDIDHYLSALRARLDADAFDAAWAEGRALTAEQAIALAQELTAAELPAHRIGQP